MKRATMSGGALVIVLVLLLLLLLLVLAENHRALEQNVDARAATSPATTPSAASTEEVNQGFLYGRVTSVDGATYEGRLRFGGDEEAFWGNYFKSETTETLDALSRGVDYTIPVGLIASIFPQRARVILHDGEELQLERTGDLGEGNAGMLIFVDGRERPEYVQWTDVEQVDFDRPPVMYPPPLGGR